MQDMIEKVIDPSLEIEEPDQDEIEAIMAHYKRKTRKNHRFLGHVKIENFHGYGTPFRKHRKFYEFSSEAKTLDLNEISESKI